MVHAHGSKSVSRKPERYMPWGGDSGGKYSTLLPTVTWQIHNSAPTFVGDFYRPPRACITQGPTGIDNEADNAPTNNECEQHFKGYFASGQVSKFPAWTRAHWTANAAGPRPKVDRRGAAFREISNDTVAHGPYWDTHGALARPQTGGVLTPEAVARRARGRNPNAALGASVTSSFSAVGSTSREPAAESWLQNVGTWAERSW